MKLQPSRRDILRLGGLGALSFLHPLLLGGSAGCQPGAAPADPSMPPPAMPPPDPSRPWWLTGNFAPVPERDLTEITLEGTLPDALDGLYLRNGSNPMSGAAPHWFLGDGMVHGVRLKSGRALYYRNRYVRTAQLAQGPNPAGSPPSLEVNASNVSVVYHAGRVLSSGEVGLPYRLDPATLGTLGVYDFGGKLKTAMTAHPKLDPVTGELHLFGYGFLPPYLTYYVVDKTGALVSEQVIELKNPVMMHDFQLTKTRAVFLDLPVVFDWTAARAGDMFPFRWKPEAGARIGLLPRGGKGSDIKWLPLPPCFIFHTLNAYDDGDQVVLEACRFDSLWEKGINDTSQPPYLTRFTLDEKRGTVTESRIHPHITDFPVLDPRRVAQKHRYGYSLLLDAGTAYGPAWMKGLAKLDTQGDRVTVYEAPSGHRLDEMTFVPKSETAGEDEGFLVGFVYDHNTDRSALWVFDAQDLPKGPIAKAHLPYRVPFGFHGTFLPKLG
ncbi:MAG: carotenoid oxygenase family protein [Polyangia bacterium]